MLFQNALWFLVILLTSKSNLLLSSEYFFEHPLRSGEICHLALQSISHHLERQGADISLAECHDARLGLSYEHKTPFGNGKIWVASIPYDKNENCPADQEILHRKAPEGYLYAYCDSHRMQVFYNEWKGANLRLFEWSDYDGPQPELSLLSSISSHHLIKNNPQSGGSAWIFTPPFPSPSLQILRGETRFQLPLMENSHNDHLTALFPGSFKTTTTSKTRTTTQYFLLTSSLNRVYQRESNSSQSRKWCLEMLRREERDLIKYNMVPLLGYCQEKPSHTRPIQWAYAPVWLYVYHALK